jgi:hypothetical protein
VAGIGVTRRLGVRATEHAGERPGACVAIVGARFFIEDGVMKAASREVRYRSRRARRCARAPLAGARQEAHCGRAVVNGGGTVK